MLFQKPGLELNQGVGRLSPNKWNQSQVPGKCVLKKCLRRDFLFWEWGIGEWCHRMSEDSLGRWVDCLGEFFTMSFSWLMMPWSATLPWTWRERRPALRGVSSSWVETKKKWKGSFNICGFRSSLTIRSNENKATQTSIKTYLDKILKPESGNIPLAIPDIRS